MKTHLEQMDQRVRNYLSTNPTAGRLIVAQALGLNESAVKRSLVRIGHKGKPPSGKVSGQMSGIAPASPATPDLVSEETDSKLTITAVVRIGTVAAAIEKGQVDTTIWEPVRTQVTSWEVGMKLKDGDGAERVHVEPLWRVFVEFRRKIPKNIEKAAEAWLARLEGRLPALPAVRLSPKASSKDGHLFAVGIPDSHFSALAWSGEVHKDYDLNIARKSFLEAASSLLSEVDNVPVERILFPVGNDFFHVDGNAGETTHGTPQDFDSRYPKMVEVGITTIVEAIDMLRKKAPVDVVLVQGNHDEISSFWLVRLIKAYYRNTPDVTVDAEARCRKYCTFGNTAIMMTHGNEEKHSALPTIFASEQPKIWGNSVFREVHCGHLHKERAVQHVSADTFGSVIVRVIPSIACRDRWHEKRGYIGGHRAAQAFLYSKTRGLRAQYTSIVGL